MCQNKDELDHANDYFKRALKIQLERLRPNHIDFATSYNNLGLKSREKGALEQANDYRRALKIFLKRLRSNYIDVATSYKNLSIVCIEKEYIKLVLSFLVLYFVTFIKMLYLFGGSIYTN